VEFDSIEIRPCHVDRLDSTQAQVRDELGWAPPVPRSAAHPIDWTKVAASA
jgi:hypothetical protein